MRRRDAVALFAAGVAFVVSGCGAIARELPTYRYRLTVEVDTPEGLRSGSSVIEVRTAKAGRYSIPSPGLVSTRVRGEAVTVDLGARGLLFALLRSDDAVDWASGAMFSGLPPVAVEPLESRFERGFAAMLARREEVTLPRYGRKPVTFDKAPSGYPMLVTFKDITDPKTVERVDPDSLAASFGKGVELRRITVQLTDAAVTTGIERRLGWLPRYFDRMLDGKSINDSQLLNNSLSQVDFKKGF